MKLVNLKVTHEYDNLSVDKFLRVHGFSRNLITHLKQTELGITMNGKLVFTNFILHEGDIISVKILDECPSENIIPVDIPVDVVYEDDDILVINKPFNMPCHPSKGNYENTLGNALAFRFQGTPFVFRLLNRLDRDTTGLLIVAKHMLSGAILSEMIKTRQISRQYLAICSGETPLEGIINAPIVRAYEGTIERIVDFERGQTAITHYKTLKHQNGHSLVHLKLETGRTHQIRVHMKHIGFPLIGDFLYNPDYDNITRQALHSWKLSFRHPITKEEMNFTAPLPPDMNNIINL